MSEITFTPIVEKCETALLAYIAAQGASSQALAGFGFRPGRDYETRPVPCVVVNGADSKEREKGARGVFDVDVELIVITKVGEGEGADLDASAHALSVGVVIALINTKATVKAAITAAGDLQLYDYWLKGSPRRINQGGEWETFISLNVVAR